MKVTHLLRLGQEAAGFRTYQFTSAWWYSRSKHPPQVRPLSQPQRPVKRHQAARQTRYKRILHLKHLRRFRRYGIHTKQWYPASRPLDKPQLLLQAAEHSQPQLAVMRRRHRIGLCHRRHRWFRRKMSLLQREFSQRDPFLRLLDHPRRRVHRNCL